jgi:hypothetical protein
MNAAAEIINELYLRKLRELPDEIAVEVFGLSLDMVQTLKALDDRQLLKLIKTNQFLITLKDNII